MHQKDPKHRNIQRFEKQIIKRNCLDEAKYPHHYWKLKKVSYMLKDKRFPEELTNETDYSSLKKKF